MLHLFVVFLLPTATHALQPDYVHHVQIKASVDRRTQETVPIGGLCSTMIPPSPLALDSSSCWDWFTPPPDGITKPNDSAPQTGCDYTPCQDAVCECDSYCCNTAWDLSCRGYYMKSGDELENNYFVPGCSAKLLCCEQEGAFPDPPVGAAIGDIKNLVEVQLLEPIIDTSNQCNPEDLNCCVTMVPPSYLPPDDSSCWQWWIAPGDGVMTADTPQPTMGCDYQPCQDAVCQCDSYCCETAWDLSCRGYEGAQGDRTENNYFIDGCSAKMLCCEPESAFPDPPLGGASEPLTTPISTLDTSNQCDPEDLNCCATMVPPSYLPPDDSSCWQWWIAPGDGVMTADTPQPTMGCDYQPCQDAVCQCDSYCCETAWDLSCRGYEGAQGDRTENNYFIDGCSAKMLCCEPESAFPDPPLGGASEPLTTPISTLDTSNQCDPEDLNCCATMVPPSYLPPDDSSCWQWWIAPGDGVMTADTPQPTMGCDYQPCQDAVCQCDSYCCETAWDLSCRGYEGAQGDRTENNYFIEDCSAKMLCCEPESAFPDPPLGGATAPSTVIVAIPVPPSPQVITVSIPAPTKVVQVPAPSPQIITVAIPAPTKVVQEADPSPQVITVAIPTPTKVVQVPALSPQVITVTIPAPTKVVQVPAPSPQVITVAIPAPTKVVKIVASPTNKAVSVGITASSANTITTKESPSLRVNIDVETRQKVIKKVITENNEKEICQCPPTPTAISGATSSTTYISNKESENSKGKAKKHKNDRALDQVLSGMVTKSINKSSEKITTKTTATGSTTLGYYNLNGCECPCHCPTQINNIYAQQQYTQAKSKGKAKGKSKGKAKGKSKGKAKGKDRRHRVLKSDKSTTNNEYSSATTTMITSNTVYSINTQNNLVCICAKADISSSSLARSKSKGKVKGKNRR